MKLTKRQSDVLTSIIQFDPANSAFCAKDVAEPDRILAQLERKKVLIKSSQKYIGLENEQLYTLNHEKIKDIKQEPTK